VARRSCVATTGEVAIVVAVIGALGLILQAMIQRRSFSAGARDTPVPHLICTSCAGISHLHHLALDQDLAFTQ
jgi:hypothetical protein